MAVGNGVRLLYGSFAVCRFAQGEVHVDHSLEMATGFNCPILGRTNDLKSAYKQFGLCVEDRNLVRIAVNEPGRRTCPNGSQRTAFQCHSCWFLEDFIWWIGFGLGIYFDCSTITHAELESSTHWAMTTLFELIGLSYAKEGPEAPPFKCSFSNAWTCGRPSIFFRPTPSWLSPGRYTRSTAAKRWIVNYARPSTRR